MDTTSPSRPDGEIWLLPGPAARKLAVTPRSLTRWAKAGKISFKRTVGGHHRYAASEVNALSCETEALAS
jgi:predicted site-specific integrase-resolvase